MKNLSDITIVIPTCNRINSLNRTLRSIEKQTYRPKEIIVVDASDTPIKESDLDVVLDKSNYKIIYSIPSVCLQKNTGIKESNSKYTFLCDDDIVISENYIFDLVQFLEKNPSEVIASGLLLEKKDSLWTSSDEQLSTKMLLFSYVFNLSIYVDLTKKEFPSNFLMRYVKNKYAKEGNRILTSGWPRITNFDEPVFRTPVYGLGASIIKTENLKKVLFDTHFYTHGIGDNYDLAIGLNSEINVVQDAKAFHHREETNRIEQSKGYFLRVAALHYILLKHDRFGVKNLFYLIWSLIGKSILSLSKGRIKMTLYNVELIFRILFNQNIYNKKS